MLLVFANPICVYSIFKRGEIVGCHSSLLQRQMHEVVEIFSTRLSAGKTRVCPAIYAVESMHAKQKLRKSGRAFQHNQSE